jgi:hypothetical protein
MRTSLSTNYYKGGPTANPSASIDKNLDYYNPLIDSSFEKQQPKRRSRMQRLL